MCECGDAFISWWGLSLGFDLSVVRYSLAALIIRSVEFPRKDSKTTVCVWFSRVTCTGLCCVIVIFMLSNTSFSCSMFKLRMRNGHGAELEEVSGSIFNPLAFFPNIA